MKSFDCWERYCEPLRPQLDVDYYLWCEMEAIVEEGSLYNERHMSVLEYP